MEFYFSFKFMVGMGVEESSSGHPSAPILSRGALRYQSALGFRVAGDPLRRGAAVNPDNGCRLRAVVRLPWVTGGFGCLFNFLFSQQMFLNVCFLEYLFLFFSLKTFLLYFPSMGKKDESVIKNS